MKKDKEYSDLINDIGNIFSQINEIHDKEIQYLTPLAKYLIENQSKDIEQIQAILERLFELVLFETGVDIYNELLAYLETVNPELAIEIKEGDEDLTGKYDYVIIAAKNLAQEIHMGQTDKAGVDYFSGHLTRVGESGCRWKDKVVGYLHDAAEDTKYSVDEIIEMLQSKCDNQLIENHLSEIKEALYLLNSGTAKSREEYIFRIRNNKIATRVKLNDLTHNMDLSRIANPTLKDFERLKRYKKEYRTILEYLGPVAWEWDD